MGNKRDFQVVGSFSKAKALLEYHPNLSFEDIELSERKFTRWFKKNQKIILKLSFAVPLYALHMFPPGFVLAAAANHVQAAHAAGTVKDFFMGDARILLHIIILAFLSLIINVFLKFTGNGGIFGPVINFVCGSVILLEVLHLFNKIYSSISGFLQM